MSTARRAINRAVAKRKTFRINFDPPLIASLAPINPPMTFPTAIVNPSIHMIFHDKPKIKIAPIFVERFTILVVTVASRKAYPSNPTRINIKKVPVPGPKIPS